MWHGHIHNAPLPCRSGTLGLLQAVGLQCSGTLLQAVGLPRHMGQTRGRPGACSDTCTPGRPEACSGTWGQASSLLQAALPGSQHAAKTK